MSTPEENAVRLREYVYRALINKAKGSDSTSYNNLVKEFSSLRKMTERSTDDSTLHLLANTIHALKDCTSALRERKHDGLLTEVLGIKLWSCAQVVRDAVLELVCNLVVANAAFTHACLQLLVYSFLPPPAPPAMDEDAGEWSMQEHATGVQSSVLSALEKVMHMVPTAPIKLLQLVVQGMPHKLRDRSSQCMYMTSVLELAERPGGVSIQDGLLSAAIEHLLSIDVEIRWEDIVDVPTGPEVEEEGCSEEQEDAEDIFELEGMVDLGISGIPADEAQPRRMAADRGGWEGTAASVAAAAEAATVTTSGRPAVDETANKMDSLMELVLGHLARRQEAGASVELWQCLLSIFERSILNTSRSKFTQYLVFFVCSRAPEPCAASFVELLLERLRDDRQPAVTRSACAAYLASFLARAAFVPHAMVLQALEYLVGFCRHYAEGTRLLSSSGAVGGTGGAAEFAAALRHAYSVPGSYGVGGGAMRRPSSTASGLDAASGSCQVAQHQVFFAAVQSVLYILCYHMRALMNSVAPDAATQAAATRHLVSSGLMPLLVTRSPLAPLAVCLPSVVTEFRHQAVALGIVELNAFQGMAEESCVALRPLEMFFPFDPYLLKRSSRLLQLRETYVRWRHGHPSVQGEAGGPSIGSRVLGGSDAGDDEDDSEDEGAEDDGRAAMDDDDDEDSSEDSEEFEGMSLPSDSLLARPVHNRGIAAPSLRPPKHPMGAVLLHHADALMHLQDHGGAHKHLQRYNGEDMARSYSPGSFGDVAGTSPVLVNYTSPDGAMGCSPMQMTPVHYSLENNSLQARLGRR